MRSTRPRGPGEGTSVTIQDVARRAGVSTATVSRTLTLPDQVANDTREAVFSAIRETGYTPNAAARSLRAKASRMVLVLLPGIGNSFFTPVLTALEEVFSAGGYGVLIGYTRRSAERVNHYGGVVRAGQVDGVLLVTGGVPREEEFTTAAPDLPISLMFAERPNTPKFSVFDVRNRQASVTMVDHMIARGHRRIAHIVGPKASAESDERLAGYVDAMTAAGLSTEGLVWDGADEFDFASGEKAAARYLALRDRPTAVFAAADEIALGFMRALRTRGISIPQDVSVGGFDDTEYAAHYDPALTTMRQPRVEMGRMAADDMLRRMQSRGASSPTVYVQLDCELVVRESVRTIDIGSSE